MSIDTTISDIISKDIIELLDLGDLPAEKQEEYRKLAIETVCGRAFAKLTDMVESAGLLEEFQKVEENDKAIREFLSKHDIDLEKVIADEALIYKAQMKTINDVLKVGNDVNEQS